MPRVSIITGIYNCADTLAEAIESILAQTYEDWEFILCDDGSSDNTYDVAKVYADRVPSKIRLISNERNMGLNHTLNHCLAYAQGEYIARMDGDDVSLPERLAVEVAFLDSHPEYAVVSTPMIRFDENGVWSVGKGVAHAPNPADLVHGTVHCHAPCLIRKSVMNEIGGYSIDDRLLRVEDWHLWVKLYAAGYRGYNLAEPLYQMRDDRNATTRRKFKYRLNESYVSRMAARQLQLPKWNYVFSLRPILVGLIPKRLYMYLHKRKMR